jgi:Zn-dependent peptidase ImmA (M78 family)
MAIRRKIIRNLTSQLLAQNNVVLPPVNVDRIAKKLGASIKRSCADNVAMSGFLARDYAAQKIIIGVNESHTKQRQRFTVAHCLGHLLMHESKALYTDELYQLDRLERDKKTKKINRNDDKEREANLFAMELLMPQQFITHDLAGMNLIDFEDGSVIKGLAKQYDVSHHLMTIRLLRLEYIDP